MTKQKSPRDYKEDDKASSSSITNEVSPQKRRISGENMSHNERKSS